MGTGDKGRPHRTTGQEEPPGAAPPPGVATRTGPSFARGICAAPQGLRVCSGSRLRALLMGT